MGTSHSLSDKYTAESGTVFMSGTQALVRLPMVQMRRDKLRGLNTATYITGYRGSPLGGYDQQLQAAQQHLQPHSIKFQPGVNEDLAATAIWGTQQVPLYDSAQKDGVVGIWYGKGPGVDRSGDVFRHGNAAGSSASGGVLCLAGDDHSCKSSTVPHQSDHGFMAARMPMLFPSSVQEFVEVGLLGIALSRYCGSWVGMKVISDTIETSAVVDLGDELKEFNIPTDYQLPEGGLNLRWPDAPMVQDERVQEQREEAIFAFARANNIDQLQLDSANPTIGIVASGKVYEDVRQALKLLGLTESICEDIGLRLYKVRMPYPLEPQGIQGFAEGLHEIIVLEERREIIEHQLKALLFNATSEIRPRVVGKKDETGATFLPTSATLSVAVVARAIVQRLLKQTGNAELDQALKQQLQTAIDSLNRTMQKQQLHTAPLERRPWFCSGCPHNTSTRVPEGSRALAGIGCHYMVQWMDRSTDTFTHMGAEGMPWTSICEYVGDEHRFVNIGDGTYYHSGLLAIRGAVASNANITYKVLYNDAVAMTGGQSLDGNLEPAQITHQLKAEGAWPVYLITDEPDSYSASDVAAGVEILHRDHLDEVQRKLRELKGCNAIVYVQTCAAEKRRRRKRGLLEDPAQRVFINSDVCEGCGDCSTQSNCVSVEPLETAFGRKRRINQSSCNKDYSCLNGFCPSFVTVTDASIKKRKAVAQQQDVQLPEPSLPAFNNTSWNILVTGVGGTGVLTIGSILGKAAHIDGNAAMLLDLSGLAQKGGAVISHVRLASEPTMVTSPHILPAHADVLIAADAVVASSKDSSVLLNPERTAGIVNTSTAPIADFVLHRDLDLGNASVCQSIQDQVLNADHFYTFSSIAEQLTGDAIASNILMLGYTWQQGLIPISREALEEAITLNGVAVDANLTAFTWGRRLAADPAKVKASLSDNKEATQPAVLDELATPELIEHRAQHLSQYQGLRLVKKFRKAVDRVQQQVDSLGLDDELVRTVAHNYARVLSYKDEYEVARLYSLPSFQQQLDAQFSGDYKIEFNLAPPILGGTALNGRPKKRKMGRWVLSLFKVLQRGKMLRGTPLDIFGYTAERKAEREWINRYEQDLELVIGQLSRENLDDALRLLALPDQLRGYGPVKTEAMQQAIIQRESIMRDFSGPKPIDLTSAA